VPGRDAAGRINSKCCTSNRRLPVHSSMLPELLRFGVIEQCGVGSGFVGTAAGVVGGVEKGQQLSCRRSHDYRVVAPLSVVDVALEFAVLDGAAKLCEARMPDMQGRPLQLYSSNPQRSIGLPSSWVWRTLTRNACPTCRADRGKRADPFIGR